MFIGRTDVKAEIPILWPPDVESWLILKDPDAGKDWGQEEKGMTEDEMVGWHHRHNGHGFGWTLGVGNGQGSLVCCGSWGRKKSDKTEQLNWTKRGSINSLLPTRLKSALSSDHLSPVIFIRALPVSLLLMNTFYLYICSKNSRTYDKNGCDWIFFICM